MEHTLLHYLVFFGLGGASALLVRRLVYGVAKEPVQRPTQITYPNSFNERIDSFKTEGMLHDATVTSRQTLLPKESRLWYRRLHQALGDDHVIVPRVKISRLVAMNVDSENDKEHARLMKVLRSNGVDFVICAPVNLKILAAVRIKPSSEEADDVSQLLKKSLIPEVMLIPDREYSVSELRGIFITKLLPPTARTLSVAV